MYKNYIFDFNGTLLDDCDLCLKILNLITKEYNLGEVSIEHYKSIFTFPVYLYYKELGFDTSFDNFSIIAKKFHGYYNDLSYKEAKIFEDVKLVLQTLKEKATIICLSASLQQTLEKQLKYYGIYEYFDFVIGLNDTHANSKESVAKEFVENKNMNKSNTLFIGDSIHDLEVAEAIDVSCVLVSTGHTNKDRLLKTNCKVIDNLKELIL